MKLTKQSIRKNQHITIDGQETSKEEIIELSEMWDDNQIVLFKKMLRQGGAFKIQGKRFVVKLDEKNDIDSTGKKTIGIPKIPGERTF